MLPNFTACKGAPPPPAPAKTVEVRLVFPLEAADFVNEVSAGLQVKPLTLMSGEVISILPIGIEGTKAIFNRMASGDTKPALWLNTSDYSSELVSQQVTSLNGSGLLDCRSLLSTRNVFVHRLSDSLDALVSQSETGGISFPPLIADPDPAMQTSVPQILIPSPLTSASGLSNVLGIMAGLDARPANELTAESVRLKLPAIKATQKRVVQYMYSDKRMLDWLSRQDGGGPLLALSNEQQFRTFMRENPDSGLQSHPVLSNHVANSYPLCVVSAPWVSSVEQSAALLLHRHFFTPEVRSLAKKYGFVVDDSAATEDSGHERVRGEVAKVVLNNWADLRKSAAITLVLDTSASMDGPNLEMLRRDLSLFLSSAEGGVGLHPTSIITFDSTVQVLRRGITEPRELRDILTPLKGIGASSVRDGILKGLESAAETKGEDLRRIVFVVVDGKDTSSKTTAAAFQLAAGPLISGKRIVLYVIGVGTDTEDYSGLPALVTSIGGLFRTAKLASFGSDLYTVWPDLR